MFIPCVGNVEASRSDRLWAGQGSHRQHLLQAHRPRSPVIICPNSIGPGGLEQTPGANQGGLPVRNDHVTSS